MMQGQLAADEAKLLRDVGTCAGRVEADLVAHGSADQTIDWLLAQLAEQIQQGEVDATDGIQDEAFAAIKELARYIWSQMRSMSE